KSNPGYWLGERPRRHTGPQKLERPLRPHSVVINGCRYDDRVTASKRHRFRALRFHHPAALQGNQNLHRSVVYSAKGGEISRLLHRKFVYYKVRRRNELS